MKTSLREQSAPPDCSGLLPTTASPPSPEHRRKRRKHPQEVIKIFIVAFA